MADRVERVSGQVSFDDAGSVVGEGDETAQLLDERLLVECQAIAVRTAPVGAGSVTDQPE